MNTGVSGISNSDPSISDVIDVIEMDMLNTVGNMVQSLETGPFLRIVEQPASNSRYRYECEGRSAGCIRGVHSTLQHKTFPTIQTEFLPASVSNATLQGKIWLQDFVSGLGIISDKGWLVQGLKGRDGIWKGVFTVEIVGYNKRVKVVVSCVTEAAPYLAHPHNLVGKTGKFKNGACIVEVNNESMTLSFDHLGIQCVKKKNIEAALMSRQEINIDPFKKGFAHRSNPNLIDLNAVRLCFQAFLENEPGKFKCPLTPVVSDIIYNKKALSDPEIVKLSHCAAPASGGLEMILLCEKVIKDDISVWFYKTDNAGVVEWEAQGVFNPKQVHKQVAISFHTPQYKNEEIKDKVKVSIQLRRLSDNEVSNILPFWMTPLDSGSVPLGLKRMRRYSPVKLDTGDDMMAVTSKPRLSPNSSAETEPANKSQNYYQRVDSLSPISLHAHDHRTPSPMVYQPVHLSHPVGACQVLHLSYDYMSPGPSHHSHLPANIVDPSLQNCNPQDLNISGITLGHEISTDPMLNLNISSNDLEMPSSEYVEAFDLSIDLNLSTKSSDSQLQSLTNIVHDAYNQFTKQQHNEHPKSSRKLDS